MKYGLLSKEQFESLNQEFATFLAVYKIHKTEWELLKNNNSDKVDELLIQFSDLVWEDVLNKTFYLEHFSKNSINLFECNENSLKRIVIRVNDEHIDLLEKNDFNWFLDNSNSPLIQYFKGEKNYTTQRNIEIFNLIKQGSFITKGDLYRAILKIIEKKN